MKEGSIQVLLADDDIDDCLLFEEALNELDVETNLSVVNDGEQLIKRLSQASDLPQILYLDLNMPRKNGYECLVELKSNDVTKDVPVVIFSTSFDPDIVRLLHSRGAKYYIRKPENFYDLKKVVNKSLELILDTPHSGNGLGDFVLSA